MSRTFVLGDIHGAYRALRQCLDRSSFDYENDRLIFLGDAADGWPETKACINELLKVKNLIYLLGNHDWWTLEWMKSGFAEEIWLKQGGLATVKSYESGIPDEHIKLLNDSLLFFEDRNRAFVHAGFETSLPLEVQSMEVLIWNRELARIALGFFEKGIEGKLTNYDEVYLGHTPIQHPRPIRSCEVWLMDTGAGWSGVLSMMDIDTKEIYTSDSVLSLYPGIEGRKRFT